MFTIKDDSMRVPIKSWCMTPEDGAVVQAKYLAKLPFVCHHVALMPDTHQGYGMPIGGVCATKDVVVPNMVGVDIGCGMCFVKTNVKSYNYGDLKSIVDEIRKEIPVGFNKREDPCSLDLLPRIGVAISDRFLSLVELSRYQLGSLGGGNHFIELQKSPSGNLCVMIHSGSRNIGKRVADYYNRLAAAINEKWHSAVPKEWGLAFLPTDSDEGRAYLGEMQYCVDWALENRKMMMGAVKTILAKKYPFIIFDEMVNVTHNYARLESHFGENVVVHRKGATSARCGEAGIIPGSQGTASYLVTGKGNAESFMSCSHGAGRTMGRKEAQRALDLKKEVDSLNAKGIVHSIKTVKDLDEAPSSYKDIDIVMEEQKDLVDVTLKLEPLAVVKG